MSLPSTELGAWDEPAVVTVPAGAPLAAPAGPNAPYRPVAIDAILSRSPRLRSPCPFSPAADNSNGTAD